MMFNKSCRDLYPEMCKQLDAVLGEERVVLGRAMVTDGLHIFAGGRAGSRLTGDGRIYTQFDYPVLYTAVPVGSENFDFVMHKRMGNFREMQTGGKVAVAQLKIFDEDHPLSVDGKGWYVNYFFEEGERQGRGDFAFP